MTGGQQRMFALREKSVQAKHPLMPKTNKLSRRQWFKTASVALAGIILTPRRLRSVLSTQVEVTGALPPTKRVAGRDYIHAFEIYPAERSGD